MQHWQQFFRRAHVRQMFVRFWRAVRSAFQRKMVNGRVQILHSYIVLADCARWKHRVSETYCAVVFLQHLHIWVIWETFFADRREVGRLPAAAIQVGLDLGWHGGRGYVIAVKIVSNV